MATSEQDLGLLTDIARGDDATIAFRLGAGAFACLEVGLLTGWGWAALFGVGVAASQLLSFANGRQVIGAHLS